MKRKLVLIALSVALAANFSGYAKSAKKQAKEAARQREAAIAALKPIQTIPVYALMQIDKEQADKAMQEYCNQKAAEYQSKAEAEKDAEKRRQLEKTAELFGGMLKSSLF